ncbi:hypothetical protein [Histidinibacterium aquaticum]|uniref:Uncharacterized protein n=1 Tax=Histidinibacterium aquaticum TaxID=2613962 RepID=A0A5J5GCQ3_9RHOB|nr:hypothetical protein [Histidinibacterium aquaticum]KAA9005935.1 hypothetical protein F3S47_15360 [Histidinibacterium aquaticum]
MAELTIGDQTVTVDDNFKSLSPAEQERTVEEIAQQLGVAGRSSSLPERPGRRDRPEVISAEEAQRVVARGRPDNNGVMAEFNRGVANFGDVFNPFDNTAEGMRSLGIGVAEGDTDTAWQAMQRGAGEGMAAIVPIAKLGQLLAGAGGTAGRIGSDMFRSMSTTGGATAEVGASAVSQGAQQVAEDTGAGSTGQAVAGIAAPLGVLGALQGARAALMHGPTGTLTRRATDALTSSMAPYTSTGARAIARGRMKNLAGGEERAEELAGRVTNDNPLGLSPAQQTGDPNMLGLERLAVEQSPTVRARMDERAREATQRAEQEVSDLGGNTEDARRFLTERRQNFATRLRQDAANALDQAERRIQSLGNQAGEGTNSTIVRQEIDRALEGARMRERELWDAVPRGATVDTSYSRELAQEFAQTIPRAQQNDMPEVARRLLVDEGGFGESETVAEMHGLYSELRRVARSAMAGTDQNKNRARIANQLADAVLKDLGAVDGGTRIGQSINEARAYSAALHETFDQGPVGDILTRTIDGDTRVDPSMTLDRTVRQGRQGAAVASRDLNRAASFDGRDGRQAEAAIQDYVKDRFQQAVQDPSGNWSFPVARRFFRDNQALLNQYPDLRDEILGAIRNGESAERINGRIADVIGQSRNNRQSALGRYLDSPPEQAFQAVISSPNAARDARLLVNAARKDTSGEALAGLKGSFADFLISGSTATRQGRTGLQGELLSARLADPQVARAMNVILSPAERGRLQRIAQEITRVQRARTDAADVGSTLSGAPTSRMLEILARVQAARLGGEVAGGSMGGSLQTANIFSGRAGEIAFRLFTDKSSQILADAVEDPEMFRALLTEANSIRLQRDVMPRLLPYLAGGVVASGVGDNGSENLEELQIK